MEIPDKLVMKLNRIKAQIDGANSAIQEAEALYQEFFDELTAFHRQKQMDEARDKQLAEAREENKKSKK